MSDNNATVQADTQADNNVTNEAPESQNTGLKSGDLYEGENKDAAKEDASKNGAGEPAPENTDEANKSEADEGESKDDKSDENTEEGDDKEGESDDDLSTAEFEVPEGFELPDDLKDEFTSILSDKDLSDKERAQKLIDMQTNHMSKQAEERSQQWEETQKEWISQLKNDKEFGGANFEANVQVAQNAIEQFGGEELKQALDMSGMGNNPALVKMFAQVGRQISEAPVVDGKAPTREASLADVLYSNSNNN